MATNIAQELRSAIASTVTSLMKEGVLGQSEVPDFTVHYPEAKGRGDFASNIALRLAGEMNRNALEIAEAIASLLQKNFPHIIEKAEAVHPGFVNISLSPTLFLQEMHTILREGDMYGSQRVGKTMVIEYSSPNIAKSFGIGHLRSTIIGQALRNIYEFLGWECVGINHLGDWGTPYGKLITQIKKHVLGEQSAAKSKDILKNLSVQDLERLYVSFGKEAEENPEMQEDARLWFSKLEQGDCEARLIWEVAREVSLREFQRMYDLLDVRIENVMGESFYEKMLADIIEEVKEKGFAKESQGALIMEFPEEKGISPAMLRKSDGASTYFTRDLAALRYRSKQWSPHLLVVETGMEQALHFRQVFCAGALLGWTEGITLSHVGHGLYRSQDGKFSTREGKTIHLEEVLEEAVSRAKIMLEASGTMPDFTEEEKQEVSAIVGIGGVKYNDLSQHPKKDIVFSWDKILNLKGDSAAYIQYTYARCESIMEKSNILATRDLAKPDKNQNVSEEERNVLVMLHRFPSIVEQAASQLSPHFIASFALDLARRYNAFYANHSVLQAEKEEEKEFRLALTKAVAHLLKISLGLLGIQAPERM